MEILTLVVAAYAAVVATVAAVVQYLSRRDVTKRNVALTIRLGREQRDRTSQWVVFIEVANRGQTEVTVTNVRLRTTNDDDPPLVVSDRTVRLDSGERIAPTVPFDDVLSWNGSNPYRPLKAHATLGDGTVFRSKPRSLINW